MAKKKNPDQNAGTEHTESEHSVNYLRDLKGQVLKCIGDVCFSDGAEGEIIVNIDKSKSPECAEVVSNYLLAKKRVRFDLADEQTEI